MKPVREPGISDIHYVAVTFDAGLRSEYLCCATSRSVGLPKRERRERPLHPRPDINGTVAQHAEESWPRHGVDSADVGCGLHGAGCGSERALLERAAPGHCLPAVEGPLGQAPELDATEGSRKKARIRGR